MNIYVGNLSWDSTQEDIKDLFAPYGDVNSVVLITDKATGRSKGFGFVEMPVAEEAQSAIANLNQSEILGRKLIVNESQPRPGTSTGGGGGFKKKSFGGGTV